ncbi:MAG: hypothetical protein K2W85_09790 [Phycisphaerales bacterium]|nr:hypothetical protein [Phycisphaerales bacterium]
MSLIARVLSDRTRRTALACVLISAWFPSNVFAQATTQPSATTSPAAFVPARDRNERGEVSGPARLGWWNDAVFYEIFVRSFKDSASGPLAGDGVGDIRGLIDKLDYLNDGDPKTTTDLGINGIWLMPMHPSPTYHGYDITDYRGINPQYGTLDDYRDLLRACHKRDIKVILDLVLNHCSSRHPWFIEAAKDAKSPKRDWFIWSATNPSYRGPWNQQVWHALRERGQGGEASPYYYGLFSRHMPDLNFTNPEVTREMLDVMRFWLAANGDAPATDGFRLDAIRHLIEDGAHQDNTIQTHKWLQEFYRAYKAVNPEAVAVGEVWASTEIASRYVGSKDGERQMDFTFEFDLAGAMMESARTGLAAPVRAAQDKVLKFFPPNQYGRFLTNHDQPRVATQLKNHPGKLRVAAAMLLTGPGVPFLYYGEEVGLPGDKPDEDIRTPMPWTIDAKGFSSGKPWRAMNSAPKGTNVREQNSDPASLLNLYRDLIRLRNTHACLRLGSYTALTADQPSVYAFIRHTPATDGRVDAAIVVINLGDAATDTKLSAAATPLRGSLVGDDMLGKSSWPGMLLPDMKTGAIELSLTKLEPRSTRVYVLRPTR